VARDEQGVLHGRYASVRSCPSRSPPFSRTLRSRRRRGGLYITTKEKAGEKERVRERERGRGRGRRGERKRVGEG